MSTSNHNNPQGSVDPVASDRGVLTNPIKQGNINWLSRLQQQTKLLMAFVEPTHFTLQYANDSFYRLTGIAAVNVNLQNQGMNLWDLFVDVDASTQEKLYRRHLLALVLRDVYQIEHPYWRIFDEPMIGLLKSPLTLEPRRIQYWLRSEHLKVERIDPQLDEFAEFKLSDLPIEKIVPQTAWEERLQIENYRIKGQFLWEGCDVTEQEIVRQLIELLIERDSLLHSAKFRVFNQLMQSLFRADNLLLLRVKRQEVKVFTTQDARLVQTQVYTLESLNNSHFSRASHANAVYKVIDLETDCQTEFEQILLAQGVRSLLLIPLLVAASDRESAPQQLMGIVGLTNSRINHFDQLDIRHGELLIPALRSALRQAVQSQFNHIHSSVEWRFLEEAERRSWGLPPEPIIFTNVYPMYGISDIRGSSDERNRAIQTDLLNQFNLSIAILETVNQRHDLPFLEQLRLDLIAYIERLNKGIKVDAEVTALQYLRTNVEVYFDYFRQCGEASAQAVKAYEDACTNEHQCVYDARDRYDKMIQEINHKLRETWDRWQIRMQQIIPHYCDLDLTDGMDHMIYVGAAINPQYTRFHLHCLRYEQLRAICDCARTCFGLRDRYDSPLQVTHLVLVQETTVDIFHDEQTEKLFDLRGSTRDTRYEIVKKRIDKAVDTQTQARITQPGMLTIVYSTQEEWSEYQQYLRYLAREGWVDSQIQLSTVEPLQGITGLKFARVRILPAAEGVETTQEKRD